MKNNKIQQTTFWKFLQNRKIEIPIIQRDYAQGRIGKEKLREKFLKDLKNALDNNTTLKLDFIYGSVENNSLNPLDGQQRLTTLWLLHWYIAFKAGKLKENESTFKKFTYETRTSSKEFCNKLSEFKVESSDDNIVKLIENQTWFFSEWKQDPTIQAMLTMLGGTSIKDNKANDIIDGLAEVFNGTNKVKFLEYWRNLSDDSECPIVFYHLDLLELKLSDDLYIKMNARGKQLSDFENFKADLVGYIKTEKIEVAAEAKKRIAHKLDTDWTDIFWKNKSPNYKIDEVYYAFINRFILNCLITYKEDNDQYVYVPDKLEKENKLFKYLYGKQSNDSNVKYHGFDIYRLEANVIKTGIGKLKTVLNRFESSKADINKLSHPNWVNNSGFSFIPEYEKKNEKYITKNLTQPQRVVFFAICCYFENGDYHESSFKKWMRVVWNIVENGNIDTISAMIGAMRLIDELTEYSHDIYNHLKDRDVSIDFARVQMEEEKEKARQIVDNKEYKDRYNKTWEEKIIEAEESSFFKGAIRFLFKTGENQYDWEIFDDRLYKSLKYFNNKGVSDAYKKDAVLLRVLISKFTHFDHFKGKIFNNNDASWKLILLKNELVSHLNEFFNENDIFKVDLANFNSKISSDARLCLMQNDLCKSSIINYFSIESYFHWWNHDKYSIFPYRTKSQAKIFVLADKRNEILSDLECKKIIEVDAWQKVKGLSYYRGWQIYFTLKSNGKKYQWWNCLKEEKNNGDWEKIENITLDNLKDYLENQS